MPTIKRPFAPTKTYRSPTAFCRAKRGRLVRARQGAPDDWQTYLFNYRAEAVIHYLPGRTIYTLRDTNEVEPGMGLVDVTGYFVSKRKG